MARHRESADESRNEIPVWAERYARNRTLHIVLFLICWPIITFLITWGSTVLLMPSGGLPHIIMSIAFNAGIAAGLLWAMATGRFSRAFQRFTEWLYRKEGSAVPPLPIRRASHGILRFLAAVACFGAGPWLLTFVFLHVLNVPPAYLQPAIAAVIVPFLIVVILMGPDNPKWPGLLWPALYAMHAVLTLAGVRLSMFSVSQLASGNELFPTALILFDVYVPLFVYGMLMLTVMHIYSRYALLRLRMAALLPMEADEKGDDDGHA
ncbi:MAG: hypothetical protein Q7T82_06730 [Armatimonadota bacterium]|nr:hypothetical protein [Armatimonadota bacterium]